MATTPLAGLPTEPDHAAEATSWLKAYVGHPEDLQPSELFAYAQVFATLAVAHATERQADATEALVDLVREIHDAHELAAIAAERPDPGIRSTEHRGYSVVAGRLLPGLWRVDVYFTADPDRGEGPSSFLSWGTPARAIDRGGRLADQRADEDAEVAR